MPLYSASLAEVMTYNGLYSISGMFTLYEASNNTLSGSNILTMPDQSGNGKSARNLAAIGTGPVYSASDPVFNNKPSVTGSSGAGARVQATFDVSLTQPYTIYSVINCVTANTSTVYWRTNAGNFTNSAGFHIPASDQPVILTKDASLAISSTVAVTNGTHVICCVYNSAGVSGIFVDNSTTPIAVSPTQGAIDANACAVMTIGSFGANAAYAWTTQIMYSGAHSQTIRSHIMATLGATYGIAVS